MGGGESQVGPASSVGARIGRTDICMRHIAVLTCLSGLALLLAPAAGLCAPLKFLRVEMLPSGVEKPYAEIQGVSAGVFEPSFWRKNTLHWMPDQISPLLEPRPGPNRNIYAPSAVETADGWRVFYGAWDGVPTGNDRIYSAVTKDFRRFDARHTVIEHGDFHHVCNVNAIANSDGSFSMVATAYPDSRGRNKPAFFSSPDGKVWNGSLEPYVATARDIVSISGYEKYDDADINGMNVILREKGVYRLYFGNFRDFGQTYRASGTDGRNYRFEGKAIDGAYAVNDVKKFITRDGPCYVMGLHMNRNELWYGLSKDGLRFGEAVTLGKSLSDADRYIVAIGWVVKGDQEKPGRRLLGYLYGAGADPGLASNRIFARWLQKKAVFVSDSGSEFAPSLARGPDRQLISTEGAREFHGRMVLYAEDGLSLIHISEPTRPY